MKPPEVHGQSRDLSLTQSLSTGAFWVFAGAGALFNLVSSVLGLFNEAVLNERGFDQKTFHLFLVITTLMSLAGQLICGWLTVRCKFQSLALAALVTYAAGLAGIPLASAGWQLWLVAALLGSAGGMIIVIFFSVWSEAFGRRHLGRIQGAAQMLTVGSSAIGPVLFAKCAAWHHSYIPLLISLAATVLLLACIAPFVPLPKSVRPS